MRQSFRAIAALIVATLVAACAHGITGAFAVGQAWQLPSAGPEARLVIGGIDARGGRVVIHASILGLPVPQHTLDDFAAFNLPGAPPSADHPSKMIVAGMRNPLGGWTSQAIVFDLSPRPVEGAAAVPHIAAYATDLRPSLGVLQGVDQRPSPEFAVFYRLWRQGDQRWPELNGRELGEPFEARLQGILTSIPLASEALQGAGATEPTPEQHRP